MATSYTKEYRLGVISDYSRQIKHFKDRIKADNHHVWEIIQTMGRTLSVFKIGDRVKIWERGVEKLYEITLIVTDFGMLQNIVSGKEITRYGREIYPTHTLFTEDLASNPVFTSPPVRRLRRKKQ